MTLAKSLDEFELIAALLHDVNRRHGQVFNTRSLRLTLNKVRYRMRMEGIGFLTKTLPNLGKAFDKALLGTPMDCTKLRIKPLLGTKLPMLFGELFQKVFQPDGSVLPHPCVTCVGIIRDILYLFYKYEIPYDDKQEQKVIAQFCQTELDLGQSTKRLEEIQAYFDSITAANPSPRHPFEDADGSRLVALTRRSRILLNKVFENFDALNIHPRHGPGAVATRQLAHEKYLWQNVSKRITEVYPFDAYFCASLGHVCDTYDQFKLIGEEDLPARVILVPKDSRGPRLISCEPVDFQWVQQGLGRAIVRLVESHPLTKWNVNFTRQVHNQCGALQGSITGGYATLDLKEASDRVSLALVRLIFPEHLYRFLERCRSLSTELPTGEVLALRKFAPMGSALCFPIMALTIWAILTAAAPNADTRERILVYGDDVIVPTAFAEDAITSLELFGLMVNRDKCCTSGFFRESCGMDAFKGSKVTPIRLRTVWTSTPSPDVYTSWIAYANSFYDKQYLTTYELIVRNLIRIYGPIPDESMSLTCPSLRQAPAESLLKIRKRWNSSLQKVEYLVRDIKSPVSSRKINGWSQLLRYFSECSKDLPLTAPIIDSTHGSAPSYEGVEAFSVSLYTDRRTSMLVRRWR